LLAHKGRGGRVEENKNAEERTHGGRGGEIATLVSKGQAWNRERGGIQFPGRTTRKGELRIALAEGKKNGRTSRMPFSIP